MPPWAYYMWMLKATWLLFAMAFGACVGSLINVLVYRLPRGISVVRPPSRCPTCNTQLTFRENLPVLGWLLLRGRCRFCRSPISPEYPLVEAFTALLFGLFYALWYMVPPGTTWAGVNWGSIAPEWARSGVDDTWPLFVMLLVLLGALVAMKLVDLRTFTIPLVLTWVPAIVGLAAHTGTAAWISQSPVRRLLSTAPGEAWAIPTPVLVAPGGLLQGGWGWILLSIGGTIGLVIGNLLVASRLISRSFADYDEWERSQSPAPDSPKPAPIEAPAVVVPPSETPIDPELQPGPAAAASAALPSGADLPLIPLPLPTRVALDTALLTVAAGVIAHLVGMPAWMGALPAFLLGPFFAAIWRRPRADTPQDGTPAHNWIMYPHARREMVLELAFLAPAAALGLLGWYLAKWFIVPQTEVPLWLAALSGSLLGYLVGGGVVWAVRILGSLGFGKEAMGLGDVHMMAAVGACLGWIDSTLAFFGAAFVGIYFVLVTRVYSGSTSRAMPYGPYLAIATLLVVLCKPLIEVALTRMLHMSPPLNLP